MALICPICSTCDPLPAERLYGPRGDGRCERCGARPGSEAAPAEVAAPLTGERNESSVLFSLATLRDVAPRPKPAAPVTESSALIDIGALLAARSTESARVFVSPLAPPVTFSPPAEETVARRGRAPFVIGATALAVVMLVSIGAFIGVRAKPSAAARRTAVTAEPPAIPSPTPTPTPTETATPTATATATATATTTTIAKTRPARPLTIDKRTTTTTTTTTTTATTPSARPVVKAAPKCCAGESELACQMRIATGGACGGEASPAR